MKISMRVAAGVLTTLSVAAATAGAQNSSRESRATGLFVGTGLSANVVTTAPGATSTDNQHVSGVGLVLGYGFSPHVAIYSHIGVGRFRTSGGNSIGSGSSDLGTRVHFRSGPNKVVPFLQAGISRRTLSGDAVVNGRTQNLQSTGNILPSAGGGANVHLSSRVALSGSALWSARHLRSGYRLVSPVAHAGLLLFPAR